MPIMDEIDLRLMVPPDAEKYRRVCMHARRLVRMFRSPPNVSAWVSHGPEHGPDCVVCSLDEALREVEGPGMFFRGDDDE